MGLFGGSEASVELQLPDPPQVAWSSLREVVGDHPSITGARFDDALLRAEFKTDMSFATYGQNMSAAVTADEAGTTVVIEGIAKRQSVAGRDSARIRKIASEILSDLEARLFQAALVDPEPVPAPARTAAPLSVGEEIEKLALLRARGFITTEEFEDYKRRLLSGEATTTLCLPSTDARGPRPSARERNATRPR